MGFYRLGFWILLLLVSYQNWNTITEFAGSEPRFQTLKERIDNLSVGDYVPSQSELEESKEALLNINLIRKDYNLSELTWDTNLRGIAVMRTRQMSSSNLSSYGLSKYCEVCIENLAGNYLTFNHAIVGWMNDDGHNKKNILNKRMTIAGLAYNKGVFVFVAK